jgi:hypothetical protein
MEALIDGWDPGQGLEMDWARQSPEPKSKTELSPNPLQTALPINPSKIGSLTVQMLLESGRVFFHRKKNP